MAYPTATHYSPNFSRRELDCRCGCRTPKWAQAALAKYAQSLEKLRAKLASKPLGLGSGYRCPKHNAAIGGAKDSRHMHADAGDVWSKFFSPREVAAAAETIPEFAEGGIGIYPTFTHLDTRGYAASW